MKILLTAINAKYIHSNLAVYNLAACTGANKAHIQIEEFTINQYEEDILEKIYMKKPDVIAFSCYIWNIALVRELTEDLAKLLPSVPVWVGGPEVSYDGAAFLRANSGVKGVMAGEGEETFSRLAAHYIEGKPSLKDIDGLIYRDEAGVIAVNPPGALMDLNNIPFCYTDLASFENRIVYYEASRGCPFSCSYCLSSIDKRVRFRSLDKVREELGFFIDRKVPQVKLVDRTFNCNPKRAREIWRFIAEQDNGITNFHFEIAADLLAEEDLALFSAMRPGLVQLEIGVQSTNEQTIKEIRRTMDFKRLAEIVNRIRKGHNIHQHLDLIAGLPGEDYDSFKKSFNDVYSLCPEQLQLGFLKVLKGSHMHEMAGEYGIAYKSRPVYEVLYTKWLSHDELLKLKRIEKMVEIYYNSSQFTHTMKVLVRAFANPFACYERLAEFYEAKGHTEGSRSRMARYDILRAFAAQYDPEQEALYRELLLLDLYLREKVKSRPSWAPEKGDEKGLIRAFYREEERTGAFLSEYKGFSARQLMHMTHVEAFSYDILNIEADRPICKGKRFVLFDYKKRDPLTYEAYTRYIIQ